MNPANPALALHALLAGGHGQQPTLKKNDVPPTPSLPGVDPRLMMLLQLLHGQQQQAAPQMPPQGNPQSTNKKPIVQTPPDSNAGL